MKTPAMGEAYQIRARFPAGVYVSSDNRRMYFHFFFFFFSSRIFRSFFLRQRILTLLVLYCRASARGWPRRCSRWCCLQASRQKGHNTCVLVCCMTRYAAISPPDMLLSLSVVYQTSRHTTIRLDTYYYEALRHNIMRPEDILRRHCALVGARPALAGGAWIMRELREGHVRGQQSGKRGLGESN